MQILAVLSVNIVCITCGMLFTWPSPAIPIILSDEYPVNITLEEASYLSVIPPIATVVSSPLFGKLMDLIGRKNAILLIAAPQIISWLITAFANSLVWLYIARVIYGLADGGILTVIPTYIGEILEPRLRGSLGSLIGPSLCYGQFLINVIGSYTSIRNCALISLVFPVIFVVTFAFMPESPYYFLMKNKQAAAQKALQKLRKSAHVEEELIQLTKDVQRQTSESGTIRDLFCVRSNLKALLISMGLRLAYQFSGITGILLYMQYIFEKTGSNISRQTASVLVTGLQAFILLFTPFITDRFGRRSLMIYSCLGCGVALLFEAIYFYLSQYTSYEMELFNWVPLAGMLICIVFFSIGLAVIPTLMLSELFSVSIKGLAVCVINIYFSVLISIVSKLFQIMDSYFGLFAPFTLFSVCSFVHVFFSYFCVPETKGKTLEEIQQELKGNGKMSDNINTDKEKAEFAK